MRISVARAAILAVVLFASGAAATELADFNAAVEGAAAHNRVALGYLRTGNGDLASLEIGRMREAWGRLAGRFKTPPDALAGNLQLFRTTLVDVSTRLVTATLMLDSGRPDVAREALTAIRDELSALRKASGIVVLADCVRDANAAMDALFVYNDRALDWGDVDTRFGVAAKASIYGYVLDRCDGMADKATHDSPEFRRLIDGARASLAFIPKAVATQDTGLLHRVLIELRSFDHLLAFRYG